MRSSFLVISASALTLAAIGSLSGCAVWGSGSAVTQERDITAVTAVQLDTSGDLTITLGDAPSLTVTAGDRVIDRLTDDIDGGVLRLGMKGDPTLLSGEIRYALTVPSLESLTVVGSGNASIDLSAASDPTIILHGSGDVDASGIEATKAALTVDGSGGITVRDAAVDDLAVLIGGSGEVTVDGVAHTQRVKIEGSGGYRAEDLRTTKAFVTLHGSGDASVTALDTLEAVIDGSGVISHGGDARITENVAGSGDVVRR